MTLRKRVLFALIALAITTLAVGSLATALTARYLLRRIDATLVAGPIGRLPAITGLAPPVDPCQLTQVVSDAVIVIANSNGTLLRPCENQPQLTINFASLRLSNGATAGPFTTKDKRTTNYRMMVRRFQFGFVAYGFSLAPTEATIRRVAFVQLAATLMSVGGAALVALWLLRRGVRPLDRIVETADRITRGERTQRLDVAGQGTDEIGRLGSAINSMLDELDRSLEQVQNSERRLRQFVQDASHELRTPITSIRGYAELQRSGMLADDAAVSDAMNRIHHESVRMSDLVNDMLQLADFDIEPKLQMRPANIVSLIQAVVADAQASDARWPIRLLTSRSSIEVDIDSNAFHRVLANLLANVRSHTPEQTETRIDVTTTNGNVVIVIRDFGPGIDPAILGEVFERFVQANPSRHRSGSGAGLGLSIARSIVTNHGGSITATNAKAGGAEFTIILPLMPRERFL